MELVQEFKKGLNKDISKTLYSPDQYYHAENWSLITKYGLSTGILRNIKGNELKVTLPDCSNVSEIKKSNSWSIGGTETCTINGIVVSFDNTSSWAQNLSDACNANTSLQALGIHAAYSDFHVVFYSLLDVNNQLITSSISISAGAFWSTDDSYVPAQTGNVIIGWEVIRDQIFLFSTNEVTLHSPSNSYGQIWKVTYDKVNYTFSLSLVYNNQLNFSIWHPFPNPGGTKGNYETPGIQRLEFTDNYNPPRNINTADSNTMALFPTQLENSPDITLPNNIVQSILSGGILKTGVYQACLRLKKTTGAESQFTILSNPLHLVEKGESSTIYRDYTGHASGTVTDKSIFYRFYNIDTDYEIAEVCTVYRNVLGSVPQINIVAEVNIPSSGTLDFVYTGNEQHIPVSLDEFLAENLQFDTVKTLQTKNNYLFYGNVKYSDFDVDFDTRAYRWPSSNSTNPLYDPDSTHVQDISGNLLQVDRISATPYPNQWDVPLEHDSITPSAPGNLPNGNPYDSQSPFTWSSYLYQHDGVTIGGEGPNIKYSFNTEDIHLDSHAISGNSGRPFCNLGTENTSFDLSSPSSADSTYPNVNTFNNFHSPYISASIRGYQRDEIYRFGIVFFSKKGTPSYVHWIADIRMPHVWMPDLGGSDTDRSVQFETCVDIGAPSADINFYGKSLGVLFEISNLSTIQDKISGFSIVRVKRSTSDRTILGQGAFYPALTNTAGASLDDYLVPNNNIPDMSEEAVSASTTSINSPEFHFGSSPDYSNTDTVDIVGVLEFSQRANIIADDGSNLGSSKQVIKNYTFSNTCTPIQDIGVTNNPYLFSEIKALGSAYNIGYGPFEWSTSPGVFCENRSSDGGIVLDHRSMGSKTVVMFGSPFSNFGSPGNGGQDYTVTDDCAKGSTGYNLYLANYKKYRAKQYNGNSFQQRSTNQYMSTGNYQVVQNLLPSDVITNKVYGGDTFICIYDNVKNFVNQIDHSGNFSDCIFAGRFFPVETTVNIDLRETSGDQVLNKDAFQHVFGGVNIDEGFYYNSVFQSENDEVPYFPKPDPFIVQNKFDTRIHRCASPKVNGELINSWGIFKEDDYLDLDTIQGELNNLILHKEQLIGFQDRGIANISVSERIQTTDSTGTELRLGTGGILERYDYVSRLIGSKHQFGFTQSPEAVFFFDTGTKNIYKLQGNQPISLSVTKGLSSYLGDNLNGLILNHDNPYTNRGLTATYDHKYNEAWFTFKDTVYAEQSPASVLSYSSGALQILTQSVASCASLGETVLITYVLNGNQIQEEFVITGAIGNVIGLYNSETQFNSGITDVYISCREQVSFTVAYNDIIDAWTSLYSFTPSVYINDINNIFSPSINGNDLWIHDRGNYCNFYGSIYPSKLTLLLNEYPTEIKVWDSYQAETESLDSSGVEIPDDFFSSIRLWNEHQDSDFRTLPGVYSRKLERIHNITGIRNRMSYLPNGSPDVLLPADPSFPDRFRSPWLFVDLTYDNQNNNSFQLNSWKTQIRKSIR